MENSQALAVMEPQSITEKTVKEFLFSSGTKLTEQQQRMFLQLAIRNQLDPFKREIYAIPYGNDFSLVTGYQTYIKRAEQTGLLNGWNVEPIRDNGKLIGARITIYRKDWSNPFVWEVSLSEFDKNSGNWRKMPEFMIKKVAIGQGFRLAFPETLSSLPYLAEEMEEAAPFQQPAAARPPIQQPQRKSEAAKQPEPKPENGNGNCISEPQVKRMFAIMREFCWAPEDLKELLKNVYKIEHSKEIPKDKYDEIIETIQSYSRCQDAEQQEEQSA